MHADLKRDGFRPLPGLVDPVLADTLYQTLLLRHWRGEVCREGHIPTASAVYGDVLTDVMLLQLRAKAEQATGCALLPTFGCARLYFHGDTMIRHTERPACEISLAVQLGRAGGDGGLRFQGEQHVPMGPGDGVVYLGAEVGHWCDTFQGQAMAQIFLHYVRRDGEHAGLAFDGQPDRFPPGVTAPLLPPR